MKPSPAQRKVLELLGTTGRYCSHVAVYGPGFSRGVNSATIRALDRAAWIAPMRARGDRFTLTNLGRAALERAQENQG